jgi:FO synthase
MLWAAQGGIHPDFDGDTYVRIVEAAKRGAPDVHVHAFSPLEVQHGSAAAGVPVPQYLSRLRDAGLSSLPGARDPLPAVLDREIVSSLVRHPGQQSQWLLPMVCCELQGLGGASF